jgi:glycosyltransferase involved in cell wall biosynthesis
MIDLLNLPRDKIIVALGGVNRSVFYPMDDKRVRIVCEKFGISKPYILSMEPFNPRKNSRMLLTSWNVVQKKYPELSLVFVGKSDGVFNSTISFQDTENIYYLNHVCDEELAAIMSGAIGFVYLSLYEGFGLSVLEAMACGTPVIASNSGGIPESVGDCGYLVEPCDLAGILKGLDLVLTDSDFREDMIIRGLSRAREFDWDSTARIIKNAVQFD